MSTSLTKAGRYQIVRELGRGAMGVVYEGFDPVIGRTVAIKTMLLEGLSASEYEEYKKRFQREAQAAGVLSHPNIVTVHDFGEDNGVLYLAMEFLKGMSLQDLLEHGKVLPMEGIIRLYDQVCSALDHAHAHQIVHRDMKPANIMILENGMVKVTDFGIARLLSAGTGMTRVGQVVGTPSYMSPEQVRGLPVDGRSDIFSLGVILYLLLARRKPFDGPSLTTVIYKIVNEEPAPLSSVDPAIHHSLNGIVAKALAKDPNQRYQTCAALAADLRNYKTLGQPDSGMGAVVATAGRGERVSGAAVAAGGTKPVEPGRAGASQAERETAPSVAVRASPAPRRSSMTIGIVAVVVLGLVAAVGGYFLRAYRTSQGAPQNAAPTSAPAASAGAQPQSAATQTQAAPSPAPNTTTTQPASAPQLPAEAIQPPPTKAEEAPLKRAPARSEESRGASRETHPPSRSSEKPAVAAENTPAETKPPNTKVENAPATQPPSPPPVASAPATSQAIIETKPPGFDVFIDGKNYGHSDQPVVANITPGQHTLSIRKNGVEVYTKTFTQTTEVHSMTVTPPH